MKPLLMLALPLLLAGCPQSGGGTAIQVGKPGVQEADAANAAPASATAAEPAAAPGAGQPGDSAATASPGTPVVALPAEFSKVSVVRAATLLPRFHWKLAKAVDSKDQPIAGLLVRPAQPVTLTFAKGRLSVSNTCNHMNGSYKLQGQAVVVDKLASTMMACADDAVMALDQEVGKRLQGEMALRMSPGDTPQLELSTTAGDVLVFIGEPTLEARLRGQPADIVFLEVAAATKPCPPPAQGKACLQVREVNYDDKGLKVGKPGAFRPFTHEIRGYEHQAGVRNVLRVKRYKLEAPAADGASQAYLLDLVVESDAAGKK